MKILLKKNIIIEDLKTYAKEQYGLCLSNIIYDENYEYKWKCNYCNKIWKESWKSLKYHDVFCDCIKTDFLNNFASVNGYECLDSNENHDVYLWKCNICESVLYRSVYNLLEHHYCKNDEPKLKRDKQPKLKEKYNINNLYEFAAKNNIKCLSTKYISGNNNYEWKCNKCEYIWLSKWFIIKRKSHICPNCKIERKKIFDCNKKIRNNKKKAKIKINKLNILQDYAEYYEGFCLSTEYINGRYKYEWKCEHNHIWKVSWDYMKYHKSWCKICKKSKSELKSKLKPEYIIKKQRKYNIEDLKEFVYKYYEGFCLSDKYINSITKYKWKCKYEHIWEATWASIHTKRRHWCPTCGHIKTGLHKNINDTNYNKLLEHKIKKYNLKKGIIVSNPNFNPDINSITACKIIACKPARQCWLETFIDNKELLRNVDYRYIHEGILKIEKMIYDKNISRSPLVVSATVLYLRSRLSLSNVCRITKISEVSIRKLYKLLKLKKRW